VYTLAIRLIELGLNKPFAKIRENWLSGLGNAGAPAPSAQNPSGVADILQDFDIAKDQIPELLQDAGILYGNSVDVCLKVPVPWTADDEHV
jgi:hypothetical protein